jgi:hypothetical protein
MESTATPCGSTYDPHSALLGGHSMPNTVVLGEGMSEHQVPHLLRPPYMTIAAYSAITLRFSDGPYESNFLKLAGTLTFYG